MTDILIKHFFELDKYEGEFSNEQQIYFAGKSMGISAWDMNIIKMPPNWLGYQEHDHKHSGQEEVYLVLDGHGVIQANGYNWQVGPGMLIRVGPEQKRKFVPGIKGLTLLTLGGIPAKAFAASAQMQ